MCNVRIIPNVPLLNPSIILKRSTDSQTSRSYLMGLILVINPMAMAMVTAMVMDIMTRNSYYIPLHLENGIGSKC